MKQNNYHRLLASISSLIILLTLNGCHKELDINDLFSDNSISDINKDHSLKDADQVYKDIFFFNLPIMDTRSYNKAYLDELFDYDFLRPKFKENYIFLTNYLDYLNANGVNIEDKISISNVKEDENTNDVTLAFVKDDDYYEMNYYNKTYASDLYDTVTELCRSNNLLYKKSYSYTFNKYPKDKKYKKDLADYSLKYQLNLYYESNIYSIIILNDNTIHKESNKIDTTFSHKQLFFYKNNDLLIQEDITDKEYNEYVTDIYNIYKNRTMVNDYLHSDNSKTNSILKLIKKQD